MRYSEIYAGMFIIRTRELGWLRAISGEICYVVEASNGQLRVRVTRDCVPIGDVYEITDSADDGHWYDVSELVMDANACIAPSAETCSFSTAVEVTYRNYIEESTRIQPLSLESAVGKICLLGEKAKNSNATVFSKVGFFVISSDDEGYAIVYQGYCDYHEPDERRNLSLRILNLNGTRRNFYSASEIVAACHDAYVDDREIAAKYASRYREETIVSSADSMISARRGGVNTILLEE